MFLENSVMFLECLKNNSKILSDVIIMQFGKGVLQRHQKHASRIIIFIDKLTHAKPSLQTIYKRSKHLSVKYFSYIHRTS